MVQYNARSDILYKSVLIKISGEVLGGEEKRGYDPKVLNRIAKEIKEIHSKGISITIVVGGGNIWRGRYGSKEMDRTRADHMGMLAIAMNCLALCDAFEQEGIPTRVQTAIEMRQIAEFYIRNRAIKHLDKGRVLIVGCGTGNPFFTTDSAAALRAAELKVDALLFAKNVDGVYDKDPALYKDAVKFDEITFLDVLTKQLKVMDSNAICLCQDNNIPILVFDLNEKDSILRAASGEKIGTLIHN